MPVKGTWSVRLARIVNDATIPIDEATRQTRELPCGATPSANHASPAVTASAARRRRGPPPRPAARSRRANGAAGPDRTA
jgi:hypothetical protein